MAENLIICFLALLLGVAIAEILVPAYSQMWEFLKIETNYTTNLHFLGFLVLVLLFTSLLAGSYPSFYISKFEPISILKGKLKFGGTNTFTRVLLGLQYAISLLALIAGLAFVHNARYQQAFDLGFNQQEIINAITANQAEAESYRNALLQNPEINAVAITEHHLMSSYYSDPIKHESQEIEVDILNVGDDYLNIMNIKLLEGRSFMKDAENDRKEAVIVTETLARKFGWTAPIGKEIIWMDTVKFYVIGVIADVYTQGLWREIEPMMLRYAQAEKQRIVIVNADADKLKDINTYMEAEWKKLFPNKMYDGWFMNQGLAEVTLINNNIVKMFLFLGLVAMILSATGLFSLVSLNIIKKTKEIGVRKVLGASVSNIALKVNTEFFIILSLSALAGCLLAWFLVDTLMDQIWDYYQPTTALVFVLSVLLMLTVSIITVGGKVLKAAMLNPVNTLRDE